MDTSAAARGRWRQILPALGLPAKVLNGKQQPCPLPGCGGTDRFQFTDRNSDGDYICRQCGAGKGITLLMKFHGLTFKQAAEEVDKIISNPAPIKPTRVRYAISLEDVVRMWAEAKEIEAGDAAAAYLISRNILAKPYVALRFMPRLWHAPSRKYVPCMYALFSDAMGEISTIHRTYLADVVPRRMFLSRPVARGGAIRLDEASEVMGIAEGIETALSASRIHDMPVWATTSERLLREWEPPRKAKEITVFGDNDENYVGHAAAYHLANRLVRRGHVVDVKIPNTIGLDWNDVQRDRQIFEPTIEPLRRTDV